MRAGTMRRVGVMAGMALSAGWGLAAPQWGGTVGTPGVNGQVMAMCVWDDGTGPGLYVGGDFTTAGGAPALRLARWNGQAWSAVGGGVTGRVTALHVFDDGRGKALYVGGEFLQAGAVSAKRLARWDGAQFEEVGGGLSEVNPNSFADAVGAMTTWDEDGAGPQPAGLIVGGNYRVAGAVGALNLARWRGGVWTTIGGGIAHNVDSLIVHDDGSGPALFVGGSVLWLGGFGGQVAGYIGKWNGVSWSDMLHGLNAQPLSLVKRPFDSRLYMAGAFDRSLTGVQSRSAIAWTGTGWEVVDAGVTSSAAVMGVFDARDGNGADLYVGGAFTLRRRVGGVWESVGAGLTGAPWAVTALCVFDDGSGIGPALYVGGSFSGPGTNIASLRGGPACPGDANGDLVVNFADLNAVLSAFGQSGVGIGGDVNGDGTVNFADLNVVLSAFGSAC